MEFHIGYPVCGFFVGLVVGITGMGGGSLMTASLIAFFGIHPLTAVGTDLVYAAVTKAAGTMAHAHRGGVDWRIVMRLATGSIPAAAVTLYGLSQVELNDPVLARVITAALGVALMVAAIALGIVRRTRPDIHTPVVRTGAGAITVLLGAVLGCLVTLTSVGAGALGLVVLFALYPALNAVRLVGSDIAHAVPLTIVAGLGHWMIGSVDWLLVAQLLVGSIPGIVVGSLVAHRIPDGILTPLLSLALAGIGVKLLMT